MKKPKEPSQIRKERITYSKSLLTKVKDNKKKNLPPLKD